MRDPYLYPDVAILRNKLDVKVENTLDLIEAEQSRANMMLLYERGFLDFSPEGLCEIHRFLFGGHLRLGRRIPRYQHPEEGDSAWRSKRVVHECRPDRG